MHAECCAYILMSASALRIHVGMSACFARPFVHQSVASARLSVRLMIVYHCARRFISRPSICLIFRTSVRPSVCLSVCLSVCMFTCTYVETNVLVCELWTSKIELTDTLSGLSPYWALISFFFFVFFFFVSRFKRRHCRYVHLFVQKLCLRWPKKYTYIYER